MRRLAAAAVLSGVVGLALPVPSASACSPAVPSLTLGAARVPQGGTLRVSGDEDDKPFVCDMTPPEPTAEPSATAGPSEEPTPDPSATPSEEPSAEPSAVAPSASTTAPAPLPMVPVAHAEALTKPSPPAVIEIGKPKDGYYIGELAPESIVVLGSAPYTKAPIGEGYYRYRFGATVKIPADLAPGPYVIRAGIDGTLFFGVAEVTVVAALPDTGRDVAPLARLAALLLVAGVGALVLDQRQRCYARISESASVRVD